MRRAKEEAVIVHRTAQGASATGDQLQIPSLAIEKSDWTLQLFAVYFCFRLNFRPLGVPSVSIS